MPRRINNAGMELIKSFESFSATSYTCPGGRPTIGWGHAILPGESFYEPISEMQGLSILARDLAQAEAAVERLVTVPLTDNQFAALVSFTFNVGQGNLEKSTLLKKLNAGHYDSAAGEFGRWVKAGGKVLEGLKDRRAREQELFARGIG